MRDAGYRGLLYNMLQRRPDYRKEFEARQKVMSEAAPFQILGNQLRGAKIIRRYGTKTRRDSGSKMIR
jgi:hypothetical protein